MRLGTADVLVRAKTSQYKQDLKTAKTKTEQFGRDVKKVTAGVATSFVSLAGTAGIAALTTSIISTGARFESEMATVSGAMRATENDFAALTAAAKLAGETTEWSATQSAEALNYMGMAGYSARQAIAALPDVLNLATAGGLDLGRASDIVTDSLTAMGLGVEDLSAFNDVLVGTITRSNTNIEMLGESLRYSAPIAAQYGYDIKTLSALLGTLANAGIKASDAGTDLRQAMVRNKKAAKELGTEETDLIGTLKSAKAAGWGVNEVTENYGMIASKSVLVLMNQLDAFEAMEKQLGNVKGETQKLANTKLDTLTGDIKILKSTIESLSISASENVNGKMRGSIQDLTATIKDNRDTIIGLFTALTTAATATVSAISNVTRSIKLLAVTGASSDKNIWDWVTMSPEDAQQWEAEIESGVAFLKDQLSDVRDNIEALEQDKYGEGLWFDDGTLAAQTQAKIDVLKQQEANLLAMIAEVKSNTANALSSASELTTTPTGSPSSLTGQESSKAAEEAAKEAARLAAEKAKADKEAAEEAAKVAEAINEKIDALKAEAAIFGMSATQAGLWQLKNEGATEEQLNQAKAVYASIEALQKQKDSTEKQQKLIAAGAQVTEAARTAAEKFADELQRLDTLQKAGAISAETYKRALMDQATEGFTNAPGYESSGSLGEGAELNNSAAELERWYSEQLALLDQYRQQRADLTDIWDGKEAELHQQHAERLAAIDQARFELALTSASSMFGSMADLTKTYSGEQSKEYKAMFAISKAFAIAEASIKLWQAIANAGASTTWPANIAAMASVASAMGGLVSNISAIGMAHDGIDSVPKTGTWILEKGERVQTAQTSARLDRVLNNVQSKLDSQQSKKTSGANSSDNNQAQGNNIRIVNAFDSSVVGDYLGSTSGEKAVLNIVKRNANTIKQLTS